MMPKISVRPEATSARISPLTMPFSVWMTSCAKLTPISDTKILVDHGVVGAQLSRGRMVTDDAFFDDVDALAGFQRQRHVLLDQQHGNAILAQHFDDLADQGYHARHQPLG